MSLFCVLCGLAVQNIGNHRHRLVAFVIDDKDHLIIRIILLKQREQIFFKSGVQPSARSDDGYKRRKFRLWFGEFGFEKPQIFDPAAKRFKAEQDQNRGKK